MLSNNIAPDSLFGKTAKDKIKEWIHKFNSVGIEKKLISKVLNYNIISDPDPLWQICKTLPPVFKNNITQPLVNICRAVIITIC